MKKGFFAKKLRRVAPTFQALVNSVTYGHKVMKAYYVMLKVM